MRFKYTIPALWCALFALYAFAPATAEACSCLEPSLSVEFQNSDHIAKVRIQKKKTLNLAVFSKTVYIARVVKSWKGCTQKAQRVRLVTPSSSAACGVTLQVGGVYLITGTAGGSKVININSCGYNKPWKSLSQADLDYLDSRLICCDETCVCGDGTAPVQCLANPCDFAACDEGECVPNYCGGCNAEFYGPNGGMVCGGCQDDKDCESNQICESSVCVDLPEDACEDFVGPCNGNKDCPAGNICSFEGCNPSSCGCDPFTGEIICTADCGGGVCVKPLEQPCDDFIEPCKNDKDCPGKMICSMEGCNPSFCGCDPLTGLINCTKDCAGGVCVDDSAMCAEGDTKDADDGCNTCVCVDGGWACTKMGCPEVCPDPVPNEFICIQVVAYGATETGLCCAYSNPCVMPPGLDPISMDECDSLGGGPGCPDILCINPCKEGYKTDKNGCQTCQCEDKECPEILCINECKDGYAYDKDGCQTCECQEEGPGCPQVLCINECKDGYAYDKDGCQTCECQEPGDASCASGDTKDADDGCNACVCVNGQWACTLIPCPGGPLCEPVSCLLWCEDGFKVDKEGCEICECNEIVNCPQILCINECKDGYAYDKDGCQTCECASPPDDSECAEGDTKDADDGCNTCVCWSGMWNCTKMFCPEGPCEGFTPPCETNKDCGAGQECSFEGCNPSSCWCDDKDGVICTEDCGGGVCVDAGIEPPCGNNASMVEACVQAKDMQVCQNNGGTWGMFGLAGIMQCQCPTVDSECPCKSNKDCTNWCLTGGPVGGGPGPVAPGGITGTCAPHQPYFGCFEMLPDENQPVSICVD